MRRDNEETVLVQVISIQLDPGTGGSSSLRGRTAGARQWLGFRSLSGRYMWSVSLVYLAVALVCFLIGLSIGRMSSRSSIASCPVEGGQPDDHLRHSNVPAEMRYLGSIYDGWVAASARFDMQWRMGRTDKDAYSSYLTLGALLAVRGRKLAEAAEETMLVTQEVWREVQEGALVRSGSMTSATASDNADG